MAFSFKYKAVKRPDGETVKTPSIPITLIGNIMSYDSLALLDSGADVSAITKDLAELLGLNLDGKVEETRGIGGKVKTIETKMIVIIEDKSGHERYQLTIPVNVVLEDVDFPVLLGRAGFFDNFIITFNEKEQRVVLKKINPNRLF